MILQCCRHGSSETWFESLKPNMLNIAYISYNIATWFHNYELIKLKLWLEAAMA